MADLIRPNYGSAWASAGEKVAPDLSKFALGWVQEMMPYQYENYLQARQDEAILYLLQKGIPEYSSTQEYTANKSLVLYNGVVYLATQTVTNVLPTVAASWKRVSTISDNSGVVSVAGGGTGATTQSQARTNLGLGTAATLDAANVVQKDVNGDFTANVITASLAGNASTADKWKTTRTIQLNGAATSSSANIDGSSNVVVSVTTLDASTLTGDVPSTSLVNAVVKTSATGAAKLPKGTTAQRPASPEFGDFRANETTGLVEYWNGSAWVNPSAYTAEYVLNRANHTGFQAISTVTGLEDALNSKLGLSGGTLSGNLNVPSLNGGQLAGMRNKIINGNFSVNQRAVSGTVTLAAGDYGHDRWKAGASGCTYTFSTFQNVTTITITAGSLQQVIEGLNLQSGNHVLSWQGTAQGRVGSGAYGASGAVTGTAVGGTNQTIEFNTGTVALVQYEPGTIATPFEHRPYGVELSLCQRYYQDYSNNFALVSSSAASNANQKILPVAMRATPTVTQSTPAGTGASWGASTITIYQVSIHSIDAGTVLLKLSAEL